MINSNFDLANKDFWSLLEYKINLLQVCKEIDRNTFKDRDQKTTSSQDEYRYAKQLYGHINVIENVVSMINVEIQKRLMNLSDEELYYHYKNLDERLEKAKKELEENDKRSISTRMLYYPLKSSSLEAYEDLNDYFQAEYNRRTNERKR